MPFGIIDGDAVVPLPADNSRVGWYDYSDLVTATVPIVVPANTPTILTNDGLGAQTDNTYQLVGVEDVFNVLTGEFDFTNFQLGDMLDIRIDLILTTTKPNQEYRVLLQLGGGVYSVPMDRGIIKNVGPTQVDRYNGIYIGNALTRDNYGRLEVESTNDCTVQIVGWYCKLIRRG